MDIERAFEIAPSVDDDLDVDERDELERVLEEIFRDRANEDPDGDLPLPALVAIAALAFRAGQVYQAEIEGVFPVPMDRQMVYQFLQFLSERAS